MEFLDTLKPYLDDGEIARLLSSLEEESVHGVILNPKRISDEEFVSLFPHVKPHPFVPHAYLYDKGEYELGKHVLYDLGAYSIQDPSSMAPAYFLSPKAGETVLDLCAAPGGKTIQLSWEMEGQGVILANDISFARAKDLSQNLERVGSGNVVVCSDDFSSLKGRYASSFDKILLDAPCSGTAMFRKNKQAEEEWSEAKLHRCLSLQEELLEEAYEMLSPGGELLYSTCSFCHQEDEGELLSFLSRHPDMHPKGVPEEAGFFHSVELREGVHLFPHRFKGEGQFFCLLQKEGSLPVRDKNAIFDKAEKDFLEAFGLSERSNERLGGSLYSLPFAFPVKELHTLRYGVKLLEKEDPFVPDFALSRYLAPEYSLALDEKRALAYLRGESIPFPEGEGWFSLRYGKLGLGWVKAKAGVAKNHYPKGLRRNYLSLPTISAI